VSAVVNETRFGVRIAVQFKEKQTPEAMRKYMTSRIRQEREAALSNYPRDDKSILPVLFRLIQNDESISVAELAMRRFNALTNQSFQFWQKSDIADWWEKNGNSYSEVLNGSGK
jgi:hypothetical protein